MVERRLATAALVVAASTVSGVLSRVEAQGRRDLSFTDAVTVALAHNGEIYLAQTDAQIAGDEVSLARSVFDPRLVGKVRLAREKQPGSPLRLAWTDSSASGSVAVDGRVETGLSYSLDLGAIAERFSSPFLTAYDPAYTTGLTLSLDQPLLRGAGRAANLQPIVVSSLRRDLTEQQLKVRLEDIVGRVEVAYWTLALSYKEREARASSVKLAEDQLAESTRLLRLGTISELDVVDAQAGVQRMKQQLIAAEQEVVDAEGKLRTIIVGEPAWNPDEVLVPVDDPATAPVSYSIDEHLQLARRNRPDVIAARAQLAAEQAALGVTKNELLPQLDLFATAGLIGFSGELARNYMTSGIFDGSLSPPYTANPDVNGGPATALKNLAVAGDYVVSVGLKLELPFHNAAAQARHDRQQHVVARAHVAEQAILAQVENEVRTSVALLKADEALQKAADESVEVNERLLAGMKKRFSAGALTSFDVLRVADELARSQIEAARARVNYRIALARLATADGTLLQQLHITIGSLRQPTPIRSASPASPE